MSPGNRIVRGIMVLVVSLAIMTGVVSTGLVVAYTSNYMSFGTLVDVVLLIKTRYLEEIDNKDLVNGAVGGIVSGLGDPYSIYLEPTHFNSFSKSIQGEFGGIGVTISVNDKKQVYVVKPIKNSPADKVGLKSGDIILKVNFKDIENVDVDAVANLIRGKVGTKVALEVFRSGEHKTRKVEIVREIIVNPSVEGKIIKDKANKKIAYIQLGQFTEHTGEELAEVVQDLKKEDFAGVILDLRYNPGGALDSAVDVSQFFVPKGPVVYIVDRQKRVEEKFESTGEKFLDLPLVVLVNKDSASASEIVAGAIKDSKSGTIVGVTTFGKGVVQELFPLDNGAGLKLTTYKYLTPAKRDIHKKGVEPDVEVEQPEETKEDVQLNKAIEVLQEKM